MPIGQTIGNEGLDGIPLHLAGVLHFVDKKMVGSGANFLIDEGGRIAGCDLGQEIGEVADGKNIIV